jgi:hypothetical protein
MSGFLERRSVVQVFRGECRFHMVYTEIIEPVSSCSVWNGVGALTGTPVPAAETWPGLTATAKNYFFAGAFGSAKNDSSSILIGRSFCSAIHNCVR